MVDTKDWRLKVKVVCSACEGDAFFGSGPCSRCEGTGKEVIMVEPKDIEVFANRPESKEYTCIHGKKEIILRPKLEQLPNGWVNWNSQLLCDVCKAQMVYAALMAAGNKIQQIKEKFNGKA